MEQLRITKGFTLIELLLSIATSAVFLLVIVAFLSALVQARVKNQVLNDVEGAGAEILVHMSQAVRNAQSINTPLPGQTASSLSLETASTSTNPTLFDVASSTLRVSEGGQAANPLHSDRVSISDFSVTNLSNAQTPGIVKIYFTLHGSATSSRWEYAYEQSFTTSASLQ